MNNNIFFFLHNIARQSAFFDAIVSFFAVYFIYIVIVSALLFLFLYFSRKEFIFLCVSGGLAWILAKILKILIHTDRPFEVFPEVQSLFTEVGYAFPSGHTMVASAIAFTLFFINKKAGYLFMFFALLIGLARIIAGVHFPIDILGGFILGALIAYFLKERPRIFDFLPF
ncbi:phosphatase PAP2 family protein [Candidatus Nomurabacteria bacterium]|nr:phosphatase PAP2 family protein [Candidatus Nomurabacteria bacterium]